MKKAEGKKCDRCWFYDDQVGNHDHTYDGICQRCNEAISSWEVETGNTFVLEIEDKEETIVV